MYVILYTILYRVDWSIFKHIWPRQT